MFYSKHWISLLQLLFAMFLLTLIPGLSAFAGEWEDGLAAYQNGYFDRAFNLLLPLAEAGNPDAMDILSDMHIFGEGREVNYQAAFYWSSKSAALGSAEGQNSVATAYASGQGVQADRQEALRWYHLAASGGNAKARISLARRYLYGEDVLRDVGLGLTYLFAAVDQGQDRAQLALSRNIRFGEFELQRDLQEANRLLTLSADQGNVAAQISLAVVYADGMGVAADRVEAAKWYVIASRRGCLAALIRYLRLTPRLSAEQEKEAQARAEAWWSSHSNRDRREFHDGLVGNECYQEPPEDQPTS